QHLFAFSDNVQNPRFPRSSQRHARRLIRYPGACLAPSQSLCQQGAEQQQRPPSADDLVHHLRQRELGRLHGLGDGVRQARHTRSPPRRVPQPGSDYQHRDRPHQRHQQRRCPQHPFRLHALHQHRLLWTFVVPQLRQRNDQRLECVQFRRCRQQFRLHRAILGGSGGGGLEKELVECIRGVINTVLDLPRFEIYSSCSSET
ncbi:hypothetical protein C8F04DRAFT_465663, partial [Mycena alexandri]